METNRLPSFKSLESFKAAARRGRVSISFAPSALVL